jgi:hypothetical protein
MRLLRAARVRFGQRLLSGILEGRGVVKATESRARMGGGISP